MSIWRRFVANDLGWGLTIGMAVAVVCFVAFVIVMALT